MNKILLEVSGLSKSFGRCSRATMSARNPGRETTPSSVERRRQDDADHQLAAICVRTGAGALRGEDITALSAPARARRGFARSFQITSIYPISPRSRT